MELGDKSPAGQGGTLRIISLNHFVNDSSLYLLSSLFPVAVFALGFTTLQIGIIVAAGYLVTMVFQPIAGRLLERSGAGKLLALGMSLRALSMVMLAFTKTFELFLVPVFILRAGSSFFHPIGASVISKTYKGGRLDSSMGIQSAFGNLGIVFAFFLSVPLYLHLGWRGPFLLYACLEMATALITLAVMRERADTPLQPAGAEGPVLREALPDNIEEGMQSQTGGLRRRGTAFLPASFVLLAFVTGSATSMFANFGNLLLYGGGLGLALSNNLIGASDICAFIGAVLTGRFTRRIGRNPLLTVSLLAVGAGTAVLAAYYYNVFIALASLLLIGFFVSMIYPLLYSQLSDYMSRSGMPRGTGYGFLF